MPYALTDKALSRSLALPNGAATTTLTSVWDLGHNRTGNVLQDSEFRIQAPALTTTELPDGETMTYEFQSADDEAFTTNVTMEAIPIRQTGAGGAGAAAVDRRFRPATDCRRFVRFRITKTGTGNPSAKAATVDQYF